MASTPRDVDVPVWHTLSPDEVVARTQTSPVEGLTESEVEARRARVGPNALPEPPAPHALFRFLAQFADPLVGTLLVAATVAGVVAFLESGEGSLLVRFSDPLAIVLIVFLNAALGFVQERRAEAALDALRKMTSPVSRVLRDGQQEMVDARTLVPGDIVALEAGDSIPADVRLLKATDFYTEEAALTGESSPVAKEAPPTLPSEATLADRINMAYLGTTAVRGRALAVVTATGKDTEIGRIGALIQAAGREVTPLEKRLARFGKLILFVCLVLSSLLFAVGLFRGTHSIPMLLLTAVSLAVAAIPEGLPAITTITLALGMQRMARRGAIVRKLPAVETLGSATLICTDKTGTLTHNEMVVRHVTTMDASYGVEGSGYGPEGSLREGDRPVETPSAALERVLVISALCNSAELTRRDGRWVVLGDPTEGALLALAARGGMPRDALLAETTIEHEVPFDSSRRRMTVVVRGGDGRRVALTKGSPDVVLERCTHVLTEAGVRPITEDDRRQLEAIQTEQASRALRVLACAENHDPGDDPESGLVFVGFVAMMDPPRPEVRDAVAQCLGAGVRVVMITGDHEITGIAIARELGFWREDALALSGAELEKLSDDALDERLDHVAVFARVSAEQKLRIVRAFKKRGEVVAVTGDGVNDAPALREAPIGVAMGKGGTDVARGAAAMVLADDNFATIVHAVKEGRSIFRNIQKFVFFLNSSNAGLVTAVIVTTFFAWMPLLTPLQLLWINLITNGLPALALGIDPPREAHMHEKPRPPSAGIMGYREGFGILLVGAVMGLSGWFMYFVPDVLPSLFEGQNPETRLAEARTMAFCLLALSPLAHAHNCRSATESIFRIGPFGNLWLWGAILFSASMQIVTIAIAPLRPIFQTHELELAQWGVVIAFALLPIPALELYKVVLRRLGRQERE